LHTSGNTRPDSPPWRGGGVGARKIIITWIADIIAIGIRIPDVIKMSDIRFAMISSGLFDGEIGINQEDIIYGGL
jgi:hypothetical protein